MNLSEIPKQSSRMVSRMVAGEHILVPLASRGTDLDSIYNLNATGTFIWEKIDGRRTGEDLALLVAEDFKVSADEARADTESFLADLLEVRAIEMVAGKAASEKKE